MNCNQNHEINHLINNHPFFQRNNFSDDKILYFYNDVESILQEGPTCGLVVLLIANRLFKEKSQQKINLDQLLKEAKKLKLTNNGEIFSAKSVEIIAKEIFKLNASTFKCMKTNQDFIIKNLFDKNTILIPYDTDANHEPCLKNGNKAHWCISLGFAFKVNKAKFNEIINDEEMKNKSIINLKYLNNLKQDELIVLINKSSDLNLLCKQGKSKHLKLFPFEKLIESNKNLFNVDVSKDSKTFMIPKEGIIQTLCDQFVLITQ